MPKVYGMLSTALLSDDQDPPNRFVNARCDYILMDDQGNWVPSPAGAFVRVDFDDDQASVRNKMQDQIRVDCEDQSITVVYL